MSAFKIKVIITQSADGTKRTLQDHSFDKPNDENYTVSSFVSRTVQLYAADGSQVGYLEFQGSQLEIDLPLLTKDEYVRAELSYISSTNLIYSGTHKHLSITLFNKKNAIVAAKLLPNDKTNSWYGVYRAAAVINAAIAFYRIGDSANAQYHLDEANDILNNLSV